MCFKHFQAMRPCEMCSNQRYCQYSLDTLKVQLVSHELMLKIFWFRSTEHPKRQDPSPRAQELFVCLIVFVFVEGKEGVVIGVDKFQLMVVLTVVPPKTSQPHHPHELFSVPSYPPWRHGFSVDAFLSLCRQPFQRSSL